MRSPDPTWPTIWQRLWASLLATPGDVVLWPLRRVPIARDMLRTWIAVHRAQDGGLTNAPARKEASDE